MTTHSSSRAIAKSLLYALLIVLLFFLSPGSAVFIYQGY